MSAKQQMLSLSEPDNLRSSRSRFVIMGISIFKLVVTLEVSLRLIQWSFWKLELTTLFTLQETHGLHALEFKIVAHQS